MTRRKLLLAGAAAVSASAATVSAGALLRLDAGGAAAPAPPLAFEVTKSEDEWRSALSPEQFSIVQSIDLLLLVVIGGLGSVHGAFLGAIFIITMPQLISLSKDFLPAAIGQATGLQAVVFGAVLIAFVLFEPLGMYGRWLKIRTYLELFPLYRQGMFKRQRSFQKSERVR